ncbi:MAG: OmpP1/FadL family transporter [Paracoccaceae bacterium]
MKNLFISASVVSASMIAAMAGGALAGGIERSDQSVGVMFEDGGYIELSYGYVVPTVSGSVGGGAVLSGDMALSYSSFSLGIKQDINDMLSIGLIFDQPYGANVSYPAGTGYPFAATTATLTSGAVTAVARYKVGERFSVLGGVRRQSFSGVASIPIVGGYTLDATGTPGVGYLVGAAYEIPDIALRVALTYNSEITHSMTGTEFVAPTAFDVTTPKSVNLEFQSGIAADTLIFGSVRWVNWSAFDISPPAYVGATGDPLVSYANDATTYSLGLGRRFSDALSASVALGYEAAQGGISSNLGPTDGFFSLQAGAKYTMGNMSISGGVRYVIIGDATTSIGASFTDNSAIGVGVQLGFAF